MGEASGAVGAAGGAAGRDREEGSAAGEVLHSCDAKSQQGEPRGADAAGGSEGAPTVPAVPPVREASAAGGRMAEVGWWFQLRAGGDRRLGMRGFALSGGPWGCGKNGGGGLAIPGIAAIRRRRPSR